MTQMQYDTADFAYDIGGSPAIDPAGLPARIAIFGDRSGVRREISEDLAGAGFRTVDGGEIANLIEGPITLLGDAVMIDCPVVDAGTLAALARLDMRVARAGAQLIVSTSLEALDDVFGALDQSDPQILVQPSRADRVLAVGRILADISNARVREMSADDRLSLLHLSRQVEAIAKRLEGLTGDERQGEPGLAGVSSSDPAPTEQQANLHSVQTAGDFGARHANAKTSLPDPHLVRRVIAARQARAKFFDSELFSDPAWDMLLDLTAAHGEGQRVSVTSLCIAADVPATTALRWLKQMVDSGVFVRVADPSDKRRAFIALSDRSLEAMARYFATVEIPLAHAA